MGTFTIYRDAAGGFRWRLTASNNRITADSGEGYTTKAACVQAVARVKNEFRMARVVDLSRPGASRPPFGSL